MEKKHQENNTIRELKTGQGKVCENGYILNAMCDFYSNLYDTKSINDADIDEYLISTETPTLSEELKHFCDQIPTKPEIRNAVFDMKSGKSPGFDGLNSEFYQCFWSDIEDLFNSVMNYIYERQEMSFTQRLAIIDLIFKKGERTSLKNYRPLSLTNTDYKIIAFVLARRLQTVIDKLIGKQQSAYIKGRNISENARLILDIFDYCDSTDTDGLLLLLDFEKAFDSVEWNFLFKTLEKFNFGPNFISWVKILYTNPIFRIKNNGWISKTCKMNRGIRQGCPISAMLYLFVAEILALKLRENNNIPGIKINDSTEIKTIQHADDLTLSLKNVESLDASLDVIRLFCNITGTKANIAKTQCILLGGLKNKHDKLFGIDITNRAVKCLGIYIGHDKSECYKLNWVNTVNDMEKLFESWKKRKLTLFGKTCIINTLAVSKFIYKASILPYPEEALINKVKSNIFNFIWNKTDRIKRNTLIGDVKSGGIGVIDIETKLKSLKAAWVSKLFKNNCIMYEIVKGYLDKLNVTPEYIVKTNEKDPHDFKIIHVLPVFYQELFISFNECKKNLLIENLSSTDILLQPIWCNNLFKFKGKTLYFSHWIKSGFYYVKDLFNENSTKSSEEILQKLAYQRNWICEYKTITSALKRGIDKIKTTSYLIPKISNKFAFIFANGYYNFIEQKCSFFYRNLLYKKFQTPIHQSSLSREFLICKEDWTNIYSCKISLPVDKKISEFNYKLLNNILCNNHFLKKCKLNDSDLCVHCNNCVENSRHLIFECSLVLNIWEFMGQTLHFTIRWKHIILGFYHEKNPKTYFYNDFISLVAYNIYKYKMTARYEKKVENEFGLRKYLKNALMFKYSTFTNQNYCHKNTLKTFLEWL